MRERNLYQKGQAMIAILFMMAIVFFLVTQSVILDLGNLDLANDSFEGSLLLTKTEGHLENAALRFLRNPYYTGESLQEGDISCTIEVKDLTDGKDLVATCQKDQRQRKLGMQVITNDGLYEFSRIEERDN